MHRLSVCRRLGVPTALPPPGTQGTQHTHLFSYRRLTCRCATGRLVFRFSKNICTRQERSGAQWEVTAQTQSRDGGRTRSSGALGIGLQPLSASIQKEAPLRARQGEPGSESRAGRAGRCHSPCRRQGPFRSHYTEHRRDVSITAHPLAVYSLLSSCLRPMLITEDCPQKSDFENSYKIDSASLSGTQCQEIYPLPGEKKEGSKF